MANHLTDLLEAAARDVATSPSVAATVTFNNPDKNAHLFTVEGRYGKATVTSPQYPSVTVTGRLVYGVLGSESGTKQKPTNVAHFGFSGILTCEILGGTLEVKVIVQPNDCTRLVLALTRPGLGQNQGSGVSLADPLSFTPANIGSAVLPFGPTPAVAGCRFSSPDGSPYVLLTDYSAS